MAFTFSVFQGKRSDAQRELRLGPVSIGDTIES